MASEAVNLDLSSHQDGKNHRDEICRSIQTWMVEGWLIPDPAYVLGWFAGPLLYNFSHCWDGVGTDCTAYSPTRIILSYLLSWPIFLVGALLEKVGVYLHVGSQSIRSRICASLAVLLCP